jgi:hypothetical protein
MPINLNLRACLAALISGFGREKDFASKADGTYGVVTDALPTCPLCQQPTSGHDYQLIASAPFKEENEENLKVLEEAFLSHDWPRLLTFQEWEGARDNADVILLKCPDGRYVMTIIYDPIGLEDCSSLLRQQEISVNDLPVLKKEWTKVGGA